MKHPARMLAALGRPNASGSPSWLSTFIHRLWRGVASRTSGGLGVLSGIGRMPGVATFLLLFVALVGPLLVLSITSSEARERTAAARVRERALEADIKALGKAHRRLAHAHAVALRRLLRAESTRGIEAARVEREYHRGVEDVEDIENADPESVLNAPLPRSVTELVRPRR